jgi:putative photosynthetic complex assembly protein 2
VAFVAALLVWGWQELAFLTGWITGPRREACATHCRGWRHFVHAVQAILWHELAIIGGGLLIAAIVWHGANPIALWTYAVLWVMRTSAKLNLFFGVRNLSEEFLPPHLAYLKSFFRRRRMNPLMPLSVGLPAVVVVLLAQRALAPLATEAQTTGLLLVAALLALAVVEHVLMVLPINATALWQWAMRTGAARPLHESLPEPLIATAPADLRPAPRD